nr:protein FAR1-RELATED SEQUENCE 1-like [Lolium perenne]
MWAKPFFTDTFCAGMTSTQRSEGANHVLKTYIPRSAPMHLFVTQYDRLITDRVADVGREEHATKQVNFLLRTGVPIEKHATLVYTRAMFERFFRELFLSGAFLCRESEEANKFVVTYVCSTSSTGFGRREFIVKCNEGRTNYWCTCKSFEHCGMPCRHVLKVLVHTGTTELPAGLVTKRWSTAARDGAVCTIVGYGDAAALGADAASMHGMLHAAAMELIGMGTTSRQAFELAIDYISHAKAALLAITVKNPVQSHLDAQSAPAEGAEKLKFDPAIAAPPRVRSRGRPKELRYKSPIESPGSRKRPFAESTRVPEGDRPRRSTRFLKTGAYMVEHCGSCGSTQHLTSECSVNVVQEEFTATRRRCKSCGEVGHNRSTCGRKSTYTPKM